MERLFPHEGKYYLWLLVPAGLMAVVLVRAEGRRDWNAAQASLVTILLLLALMVWGLRWANRKPRQLPSEAITYDRAIHRLLLAVAIGFSALVLNANRWRHWPEGLVAKAIGYGTLVAGAFFIAGVLLGYLFGLRPVSASQSSGVLSSTAHPQPSTNLEEIADWLTKLILGAGLVELTRLRAPIAQFTTFMAKAVGVPEDPGSPAIALAIMGFFSVSGLLYGYLWTRYERAVATTDTSGADPSAPALVDGTSNPASSTEEAISGDP